LNPQTAAKLGIKDGDWIYIETPRGRIKQKLKINEALDARVIFAAFGWWFPEKPASELHGWQESNLNILTTSDPRDPALGSPNLRGGLCRVYKAD
jgi:anaerobic selenocysteine-containing dehydrogenase